VSKKQYLDFIVAGPAENNLANRVMIRSGYGDAGIYKPVNIVHVKPYCIVFD